MKTEREFLHDISTPVATALFLIDSLLDNSSEVQDDKLKKLQIKLEEIKVHIESRRNDLKTAKV